MARTGTSSPTSLIYILGTPADSCGELLPLAFIRPCADSLLVNLFPDIRCWCACRCSLLWPLGAGVRVENFEALYIFVKDFLRGHAQYLVHTNYRTTPLLFVQPASACALCQLTAASGAHFSQVTLSLSLSLLTQKHP
jgi:hypothetical protein